MNITITKGLLIDAITCHNDDQIEYCLNHISNDLIDKEVITKIIDNIVGPGRTFNQFQYCITRLPATYLVAVIEYIIHKDCVPAFEYISIHRKDSLRKSVIYDYKLYDDAMSNELLTTDILNFILNSKLKDIYQSTYNLLCLAIGNNNYNAVKYIVDNNYNTPTQENLSYALSFDALNANAIKICEYLIPIVDISTPNIFISIALVHSTLDIAELLIANGCNTTMPLNIRDIICRCDYKLIDFIVLHYPNVLKNAGADATYSKLYSGCVLLHENIFDTIVALIKGGLPVQFKDVKQALCCGDYDQYNLLSITYQLSKSYSIYELAEIADLIVRCRHIPIAEIEKYCTHTCVAITTHHIYSALSVNHFAIIQLLINNFKRVDDDYPFTKLVDIAVEKNKPQFAKIFRELRAAATSNTIKHALLKDTDEPVSDSGLYQFPTN